MNDIRFADLFCGIGGFHLGLSLASKRYKCVFANDNDPEACKIYWEKFDDVLDWRSIRKIDKSTIPDIELLCGGFPCQAFSIAGGRQGFSDPRGTLFFEICEILRIKQPKYIFLENVEGLTNHEGGQTFYTILRCLDELGYNCQWQVLNSRNFNVPHNRERIYIIGYLRERGNKIEVFPLRKGIRISKKDQSKLDWISTDGSGIAHTLDANYWKGVANQARTVIKLNENTYRFLTPIECERLQGFPDNWTKGTYKDNLDMFRYHALGNAVTVNVIKEIGLKLIDQI